MLNSTSKLLGNAENTSTLKGKRRLAALLLASAGPAAMAMALAASVSPAEAACTISHAGNPWTIICDPGADAAANPDASVVYPSTNSYNSANLGLVVTVNPAATVTPAGGNWYFGESTDGTDSGGYWYFTNGNSTVSSTILGNVIVGGNSALATNNANFTNYGDITGLVGLGTANAGCVTPPAVWFGGNVTVFNGSFGIIGGNVTVFSGNTLNANPSGFQNFDNEGQILGNVLLSTAGSQNITIIPPAANVTVANITSGNLTIGCTTTSNGNGSILVLSNGGPITAVNGPGTTTVTGAFQVLANGGASLTNGGNIAGPVNVVDSLFNSWTSSATNDVTATTFFASASAVTSTDSATVTVGSTVSSSSSSAFSDTTYTSVWSAGTTALLINTGTIGGASLPLTDVLVQGDQSAIGNNSGFIYGNVTVTSFNTVGNTTSVDIGNSFSSHTTTDVTTSANATNGGYVFTLYSASSTSLSVSDSHSTTATFNYAGGNASLTNSGLITGAVTVSAADSATLANSGTIGTIFDPMVVANSFNVTSASVEVIAGQLASGTATNYSINTASAGNVLQTFAYSTSDSFSETSSLATSNLTTSIGGIASLTNSGNIGASVTVIGQALGSVVNSGLINGDVNIQAYAFMLGGNTSTAFGCVTNLNEVSSTTTNTGANTAIGAPGNVVAASFSSTWAEVSSGSTNVSTFTTYTGGNASLVNSGNITGTVSVEGVNNATLTNTGTILDPYVAANSFNSAFSSVTSFSGNSAFQATGNYTGAFDSSGNFIQTFTAQSLETSASTYTSQTAVNVSSTGGVALLTNTGNIGNATISPAVVVIGQASANLTNAGGVIYSGDILVQAIGYNAGCVSSYSRGYSGTSAENTSSVVNTGNDTIMGDPGQTVASGFTFASVENSSWSRASSTSFTYVGGVASFTNSGVVDPAGGTLSVIGITSATFGNSGNLTESTISVLATGFNTMSASTGNGTFAYASNETTNSTYAYVGSATVTNTTASGNFSKTVISAETTNTSSTSAGGTALFTNSGNISGNGIPLTINVVGDTSATLINSGNIWLTAGNITSGGVQINVTSVSGNMSSTFGCMTTSATADAFSYASVSVTTGNATPNYTQSSTSTDSHNYLTVSASTSTFASSLTAGTGNLTNSGNITGSVNVTGVIAASLTNSGFIGAPFGTINVIASETTFSSNTGSFLSRTSTDSISVTTAGNNSGNFSGPISGQFSTYTSAEVGTANYLTLSSSSSSSVFSSQGGNASLVNSGTIGVGNLSTLKTKAPMNILVGADVSATAMNSGAIFGSITVLAGASATSMTAADTSTDASSYAWSDTYATTMNGNLTTVSSTSAETGTWSFAASGTSANTANVTGGIAALTNTGNITGDAAVYGNASATLINTFPTGVVGAGNVNILGNVTVNSVAWNTLNSNSYAVSDQGNFSFSESSASTVDASTGIFSAVTAYSDTGTHTSVDGSSYLNTTVSNATTASLVNDGTIGSKKNSVNVVVTAGTTASTINTGVIFGNLSDTAFAFASTASGNTVLVTTSAESSSLYRATASGGNVVNFGGNFVVGTYVPYTPSFSSASSTTWTSSETSNSVASYNVTGGSANVTNTASGKGLGIIGSVLVSGPGGALLTNAGNITGVVGGCLSGFVTVMSVGNNTLSLTNSNSLDSGTSAFSVNQTQTQSLSAGNVISTTFGNVSTEMRSDTFTSLSSSTFTSIAAGTSATLVNSSKGTIGTGNASVNVDINVIATGPSATFTNSGLVWAGNVNVIATMPSFSNVSTESTSSVTNDTQTNSSTFVQNTGNIVVGSAVVPSYYSTSTESGSSSFSRGCMTLTTQTSVSNGGAATLTNNSGGIMIVENMYVSGDGTASVVNSGTIGPETAYISTTTVEVFACGIDLNCTQTLTNVTALAHNYTIISSATNFNQTSAHGCVSVGNSSDTFNESGTLSGTTVTTTNSFSGGNNLSGSSLDTVAINRFSSGGNATLINNSGAVIGGYPVTVNVIADQVATVTNLGRIDGNVSVMGYGYSLTSVESHSRTFAFTGTASSASTAINTGNLATSYTSTVHQVSSVSSTSSGMYSAASVDNVVSGVASLTNGTSSSISGNVTVSGPYGATLVNSGTIGGVLTNGNLTGIFVNPFNNFTGNIVIGKLVMVTSNAANVTGVASGNFSGMATSSDTYNGATTLGSDANLTSSYTDVGGRNTVTTYYDTATTSTTQLGVGASLTNNAGAVIGSSINAMAVVVDAVGPSTVVNNGIIWGDVTIGGNFVNTSFSSADSYSATTSSSINNQWTTVTTDPGNFAGNFAIIPTSWANVTMTSFSTAASYSESSTTVSVVSPASYSGSGSVFGSLNIVTSGNASLNNTGKIGSPQGGGSVDVVSTPGFLTSYTSAEVSNASGNSTDANISSDGSHATDTFTGVSTVSVSSTSATTTTMVGGGTGSLNNSGTIGGNATNPIFVLVSGPLGASANNSGSILGDIELDSNGANTASSFSSNSGGIFGNTTITISKNGKLVSQTITLTEVSSGGSTETFTRTPLGGNATLTNSGTITGEVVLNAAKNGLVTNTGAIWQGVQIAADSFSTTSFEQLSSLTNATITTAGNATVNTSITVNTITSTGTFTGAFVSTGGNATLINSGSIGLLVGTAHGNLSIYQTDIVDGDGQPNVSLSADQNANVTNALGAQILGNVSEYIIGRSLTSNEVDTNTSSLNVTMTVTGPVLAGGGSAANTTLVFSSVANVNLSTTSVDTGGTATLTNNGNIGQSFAPSLRSTSGCVTVGGGGVYLHGEKAATIVNNGLIGVDAEATASAFTITNSLTSVESVANTTMIFAVSNSLTNTATTITTLVSIFSSTSSYSSTPTGGVASITNSKTGVIGIDELDARERPVGTGASVIANGQAGAIINNAGFIQGTSVEAYSHASTSSEVVVDIGTVTYGFNSSIGGCLSPIGGNSVHTYTNSVLAGGGTATITNSGQMLTSSDTTFFKLGVLADSYGNATVINQKGAVIVGDVVARSGGNSTMITAVTTKTYTAFGLGTEVQTQVVSGNWSGGTAFIDNAGNIGGYTNAIAGPGGNRSAGATFIAGNVYASGFTMGKVLNEAGASILNDASANSSRENYAFSSTTISTGPGFCYPTNVCAPTSSDVFVESVSWVGGTAIMDNFGYIGWNADAGQFEAANNFDTADKNTWGGVQFANLTNEQGAYIGGNASANSLFIGVNNNTGNVTSPLYGGFASVINKGIVGGGFAVTSLKGSTLFNAQSAQFGNNGSEDAPGFMLTVAGQNMFTNFGTIGTISGGNLSGSNTALTLYLSGLLGLPSENADIEFMGNTTATNYGIIDEDLVFTNVASGELNPTNVVATANFTFGQGSVLTGDINDLADVPYGETYANLTLNFSGASGIPGNVSLPGGGLYQGNIWAGVVATNVTAPGRWILTGTTLNLGQTTINNAVAGGSIAWLQIGTPLNFFLNNPGQLLDVILGQNLDPLEGLDPFIGNSAVNPAVNALVPSTLSSNLISATKNNPIITGNISIGPNGGLEGQAIIVGGVANSGYLLPGWMLPNNTSSTLVNLIANTNQILPGRFEISNDFTQSATGTFLTNFAPTINRPVAKFVGTQAGPFAPTTFWLSVAPFEVDTTPSSNLVVDGNATVNGTVDVYVQTSGLYVNGDKRTIVFDKGNLTLATTATTAQTFPSPFVHFGLATGNATVTSVAGIQSYNTLNVVVQRTSYSSVAPDKNAASVGVALDSAVPVVSNEISGASGYVFPNITAFNNAQDMAGFLSDLDWRAGNASNAGAILDALVPSGYAALLAIDSGEGFRNEVNNHLLDARGEGSVGDPLASAFIQAYGMSQRVNSTSNGAGLVGDVTGLSAGIDVQATDAAVVGFAMGWSHTSLGGNQDFGGGINAIQGGIYTTIEFGQFYIDATVWENMVHGTVTRDIPVLGRSSHASYKDDEFRADAEVGYRFNLMDVTAIDNFGVTPFAAFHYRGVDLGNFSETGAGALGVDLKTLGHDIFQPELGVTADGLYHISPLVLVKPLVGIGVGFGDAANSILAEFQGGGSPFTVVGPQKNGVFITPQAGMQFQIGPVYSLSFTYRGAIGQGRESEGGWVTFKGVW